MSQTTLSDSERNALRVYLQRMEVRLSTQHRIATAFIGGAGLLLLIPIFFRDVIDSILSVLLALIANQFPTYSYGWVLTLILYITILYPFFLSLAIPLYGVYLLVKDIVHFYFTIYMPDYDKELANPTFALWAGMFPSEESPTAKQMIHEFQYQKQHVNFVLPISEKRRNLYFDTVYNITEGNITPASRANLNLPDADSDDVRRLNTAFGIARAYDRTLTDEVALTEMMLVRNILYLRRVMLRYVKTLLMFIWTTFTLFLVIPFLHDSHFPAFIILAAGYCMWSIGVLPIMRLPLYWVYRHRAITQLPRDIDPQLMMMEATLRLYGWGSIVASVVALGLSLIAWLV